MLSNLKRHRFAGLSLLIVLIIGVMGGDCVSTFPPLPGPDGPSIVTLELVNDTDFFVDPFIYVHPDENVPVSVLISDENLVLLDPPELEPGEIVELDFFCEDIGAVITDRPLLLDGDLAFESSNSPLLRWGDDFLCGDLVTFFYLEDPVTGEFFVEPRVNNTIVPD